MHAAPLGRSIASSMITTAGRRTIANTLSKPQRLVTTVSSRSPVALASRSLTCAAAPRLSTAPRPVTAASILLSRTMATDAASSASSEQLVLAETRGPVRVLTLNRPKALNALSTPLFTQLNAHLLDAQADDSIRAIVLTGGKKVWAAGADIKEMKDKQFAEVYKGNMLGSWDEVIVGKITKPVIGAVNGYAVSLSTARRDTTVSAAGT